MAGNCQGAARGSDTIWYDMFIYDVYQLSKKIEHIEKEHPTKIVTQYLSIFWGGYIDI